MTCNNCDASYNYNDGFNLHNTDSDPCYLQTQHTVTLNNCTATGNDVTAAGSPRGDGVTAHNSNHTIYIHGGAYYNNGKSGLALVDGAQCYIDGGAVFYGNGTVTNSLADIYASSNCYLQIENAVFKNLNSSTAAPDNMQVDSSTLILSNCLFYNPLGNGGNYINGDGLSDLVISSSIFCKGNRGQTAVLISPSVESALVENCSFSDNTRHIDMSGNSNVTITNCIFYSAGEYAILCDPCDYNADPNTGYNLFYGNALDIYQGSLVQTDISSNPLFTDADNNDYHLRMNSPCIDAGDPNYPQDANKVDIDGDARVIGVRIDLGADEYSYGKLCDLSDDGIVNFKDFGVLSSYWMDYVCSEPNWCEGSDFDESGTVDFNDLRIFTQNWLWRNP